MKVKALWTIRRSVRELVDLLRWLCSDYNVSVVGKTVLSSSLGDVMQFILVFLIFFAVMYRS